MANISDTHGIFKIDVNEYEENQKAITEIIDSIQDNDAYGINVIDDMGGGIFHFVGNGRWNFENSLSDPFLDHILPNVSKIKFDYYDYECGCQFLVHEVAEITPNKEVVNYQYYNVKIIDTEDLDYTNKNLVDYDFEDGYEINQNNDNFKTAISDFYLNCDDKFQDNYDFYTVLDSITNYINENEDGYILNIQAEDFEYLDDIITSALSKIN